MFKGEILKPIENITVLDFSSNLPGPLCSSILISLGARVIKVESPDGDPFRKSGAMWTSLNIGKESISINLKTQAGKDLIYDLVRISDVVIEGRDIGTVVFPDADYKFYLVADLKIRAVRRKEEMEAAGEHFMLDEIIQLLEKRDDHDYSRKYSPLIKAEDAVELDTTDLSIEEQVNFIINIVT